MKILHLTDFHFDQDSKSKLDHLRFVDSFIDDIKNEKFDIVFFTGDLVYSGNKLSNFNEAKEILINRVSTASLDQPGRFFICCGNHDIHRNQELIDTTEIMRDISDNNKLESFLSRQMGKSFQESLKNLKNYNDFQKQFYDEFGIPKSDFLSDLYSTHYRTIEGVKIGILSLNSAWRAIDSRTDRSNLIYPISTLKHAISELKESTDFRILIMHHPISDFKDWNASDIEDLVFSDFHMFFSGHLHKKKQSIQFSTEKGLFCCVSSGTLAPDKPENGYSIIDIDLVTYEIQINNRYYSKESGVFLHPAKPILTILPMGEEKRESNDFRKLFRKRFTEERERANELFISYDDREVGKGFLELFTDPILKQKTQAQIAKSKADTKNTPISDILSSAENYIIFGKDKSGKTSILYKCLLDLFFDFTSYKTFPIYIDYKELIKFNKPIDLYKKISMYFEMNAAKAKALPEKYRIKLLIDNYDPEQEKFNDNINKFLNTHNGTSFIATMEEKLATSFASFAFDDKKYSNLFIHEISRPEVRSLANKWPNITPEKKEIILEKISEIFTQLNIPTNYWTVSLFIWIFEKNNDANFHNSFELIQLYIDNLLDRKRIAIDKKFKIKFEDLKMYLAALSHFLLIDRAKVGYTATYSEIVNFTSTYRENNKRFVIEVKDVIDLILYKNILRKVSEDRFTFRLNGVFEYFLALHMSVDKKFRDLVINDEHYYLSFKNEFELLAGFEKNSEDFVKMIFERTEIIFKGVFASYSQTSIDRHLQNKVSEIFDITVPIHQLGDDIKRPLPVEKQDEILGEIKPLEISNIEVKVKEYFEEITDSTENLENALHILARVFRNSNIQNQKDVDQFLDFILDAACYLGFKLIDEVQEGDYFSIDEPNEDKEKVLVQLITNFMPIIVQTFLFDTLAQNDLERIFIEKINYLKQNGKSNQFKLLLLYFTVIDLDLNSHKKLIEEIIDLIDLDILRQTTILKLYIYLMFKCSGKPQLEDYIKEKISLLTKIINPKFDKSELQKGLIKTTRFVHLKDKNSKKKPHK